MSSASALTMRWYKGPWRSAIVGVQSIQVGHIARCGAIQSRLCSRKSREQASGQETPMTTASDPAMSVALARGALCTCPACGEGKLFRKFLKVADTCPACGEALHHHRADDMPAYIVMSIVGHIV